MSTHNHSLDNDDREAVDAIVGSFINGQKRQMTDQIGRMGWSEFTYEFERYDELSGQQKVEVLCTAIRLEDL